jgi:DNA-directed RNA polymerase specialized sigma24 family protein
MALPKTAAQQVRLAAYLLEKRAYAALPWGYRFAEFAVRLAEETSDAFGRMAYALFAYYGVQGLPPIKGVPPTELVERKPGERPDAYVTRFLRKAPRDYGKRFGHKAFIVILKRTKSQEKAEDLLQEVALKMTGDTTLRAILSGSGGSKSLEQVESLIITAVLRMGIDQSRRKDNNVDALPVDEKGDDVPIKDVSQWGQLDSIMNEQEMAALVKKIEEKVPARLRRDLKEYLELITLGVKDAVILDKRLLSFMRDGTRAEGMDSDDLMALDQDELEFYFKDNAGNPVKNPAGGTTNWSQYFRKPINNVLKEHLEERNRADAN